MRSFVLLTAIFVARAGAQFSGNGVTNPSSPSGPPIGIAGGNRGGAQNSQGPGASVFLSGSIAMEDGAAIPGFVAIQRICAASAQTVAHADEKGHFSFQWGTRSSVDASAAEAGTRTSSGMVGIVPMGPAGNGTSAIQHCELRASLSGYRSDVVDLTNRKPGDSPNVGLIVLHRTANDLLPISASSLAAPKPAAKAYQQGVEALRAARPALAAERFRRATTLWPGYAEAWIELGVLAGRKQNWDEAAHCMETGLKLNPSASPQAWYVNAMANYYLKNYDAAEKSAREALRLDPEHRNPRAGYVLGMTLAQKRDYAGASAELRAFLAAVPNTPDAQQVKAQLAEVESFR